MKRVKRSSLQAFADDHADAERDNGIGMRLNVAF